MDTKSPHNCFHPIIDYRFIEHWVGLPLQLFAEKCRTFIDCDVTVVTFRQPRLQFYMSDVYSWCAVFPWVLVLLTSETDVYSILIRGSLLLAWPLPVDWVGRRWSPMHAMAGVRVCYLASLISWWMYSKRHQAAPSSVASCDWFFFSVQKIQTLFREKLQVMSYDLNFNWSACINYPSYSRAGSACCGTSRSIHARNRPTWPRTKAYSCWPSNTDCLATVKAG